MRTSPQIAIVQDNQVAPASARRSLSAHAVFWITVVLVLVVDLWSKAWVFKNLGARETRTAIPGVLEFRRSLNDGAVFGSFTGQVGVFIVASLFALAFVLYLFVHSSARQRVLHVSLAFILAGALGNLYDRAFMIADVVRYTDDAGLARSHIGKIVGSDTGPRVRIGDWPDGGSPQTFVRADVQIRQQGVVRDFLKFVPTFPKGFPRLGGYDVWPWIFNVADAALVVGVIVLMLASLFERSPRRHEAVPMGD
jgi:lipoprotein signal peptidase